MKRSKFLNMCMLTVFLSVSACSALPTTQTAAVTQAVISTATPTAATAEVPTVAPTATMLPPTEVPTAAPKANTAPVDLTVMGTASLTESFTVTDALGRTVTFEQPPLRVALSGRMLFGIADVVYTFPEASKRIAAIGDTGQGSGNFIPLIDPTFNDKMQLGSQSGPEQIAAAQPDLVIMKTSMEKMGESLEEIKIPVVYVDFETPEQYNRDLITLGQVFQNEGRAKEVAAFYQEQVDRVSQAVSGLKDEEKPRVLVMYYSDRDGQVAFNVPPMTWMQTLMVQISGGIPVWQNANPGDGWTKVSLEQIAAWDPDQIFVISYFKPVADVITGLRADPMWQQIRALKENKIFGFVSDLYSWDQPDTRWILGLLWMAGKMHPDLFPNLDIQKEAQIFYQQLYGMDEAAFTKDIMPTLSGDIH
jgi:iron complex transport system substrate-binding protein